MSVIKTTDSATLRRAGRSRSILDRLSSHIWPGRQIVQPERPFVLIVSHQATLSGAPIVAQNLALQLSRRYNVVILSLWTGAMIEAFRDSSVEVWCPRRTLRGRRYAPATLRRLTEAYRLEFAILNSAMSHPAGRHLAERGIPFVTLMHEFAAYLAERKQISEVFGLSHAIVFEAQLTKDDAARRIGHPANAITNVIPQGKCKVPDVGQREQGLTGNSLALRVRPTGSEDAFLVLGVGGAEYRKGPDLFIEAAAKLRIRAPDVPWRFVWIGSDLSASQTGDLRLFLSDQIDRSGLTDVVEFLPATHDIETAYKLADAFLLSSRLEPLGNVAIDALSHGLPVFCFECAAGIAEFMDEAGLAEHCVAPYLDIDGIADKMITFARNSALRDVLARKARQLAADRFDMRAYADRLAALFDAKSENGRP